MLTQLIIYTRKNYIKIEICIIDLKKLRKYVIINTSRVPQRFDYQYFITLQVSTLFIKTGGKMGEKMDMRKIKLGQSITLVSILMITILCSFVLHAYSTLNSSQSTNLYELSSGWEYYKEDSNIWEAFKYPGIPPVKPKTGTIQERIKLMDGNWRDPCLFIKFQDQDMEVWMDENRVYSFGSLHASGMKRAPGPPWHIIPLEEDFKDKLVTFKLHSIAPQNTGRIISAFIGSRADFLVMQIKAELPDTILATIYIFIGASIFIVFLKNRKHGRIILPLALFSMCIGVWIFTETSILRQYVFDSQIFWIYTAFLSAFLMPVSFCLSIRNILPAGYKPVIDKLWQAGILYAAVSFIADAAGLIPIIFAMTPFTILLLLIIFILSGIIIKSSIENSGPTGIMIWGFAGLTLTAIYDISGWYFKLLPWNHHVTPYGMLAFVLSLLFMLDNSFYEAQARIKSFSEEIKRKDMSLYENELALQQALEYDKLKNEFFASISHDFRTPLNLILGNLSLMDHYVAQGSITSETKDVGKYIKTMKQNCYRLLKLINNLIDLTRIDSGFLKPVIKNCNIVELVRDIAFSAADYAVSKDLALYFHSNLDNAVTACDPDQVERIVLNLLSNAVKFTKPGGSINIMVDCDSSTILITVSDTGIGIPAEKLDTIFERFSQVDKSFTRSYEGSGIGLSLVRSLVEMHGGSIKVKSETGKGSEFTVAFPVMHTGEEAAALEVDRKMIKNQTERMDIEFSDIYS